MIKRKLLFYIFLFSSILYSQDIKINKIEPPNWWVGMKWNKVQLMVYGENLKNVKAKFSNGNIRVLKIYKIDNPNYAFIDIEIPSNLKPSDYNIIFENNSSKAEHNFPVLKREWNKNQHKGFTTEDIIYLIMPDRFADGDTSNNVVKGFNDIFDRSKENGRHGGDIQGIIDHLDYIKDAGFTAIWINPLMENNARVSYHGYSATDLYKIDPRLGTNELYKKLIAEAHKRGLKIILDHVANHIHINHPWMRSLPFKDWVNGSGGTLEITNHDKVAIVDIHGDKSTLKSSTEGWFTDFLPDMNQKNPYMANYLTQNTIWWMEYSGIDAIREDTYPYSDPQYMSDWAKAILNEYPETNIVGEVWKGDPVYLSSYQEKSIFTPKFNSNLPAVTDFALSEALRGYLNGSKTLQNIYEIIGMDFVYHDSNNLVTFIDNHDITRAMFVAKENADKVKIALQILLTTRGIPQLLYAAELGASGSSGDGSIRLDFPGGFPRDERNAFTAEGRTEQENEFYNLVKQLISLRKNYKALSEGKLIHFPVRNNVYVYFRILGEEKIMIVVNDNKDETKVELMPEISMLQGCSKMIELKSGNEIKFNGASVTVKGLDVNIYNVIN